MKKIFIFLELIGILVIIILSFLLLKNPYEIIPAISITGFDKPLWLCVVIIFSFVYSIILMYIYETIKKRKAVPQHYLSSKSSNNNLM